MAMTSMCTTLEMASISLVENRFEGAADKIQFGNGILAASVSYSRPIWAPDDLVIKVANE